MQNPYKDYLIRIPGCGFINSTQRYYATDDPQFWRPAKDKNILKERIKAYSYSFNSEGFRCDDFSDHSEMPIVFLGCSNTCGVGLELEHTWPYVLIDKIKNYLNKKIPLWNLATAGSSIDKQALLLEKYIFRLKPKLIFFLIPSMYRRFLYLQNEFIEYLPMHRSNLWRPDAVTRKVEKFDSAFTQEEYAAFETFKNLLLINRLAWTQNATVYYECWIETDDHDTMMNICNQLSQFKHLDAPYTPGTAARDASHPGLETNKAFAEHIFEKIKKNL